MGLDETDTMCPNCQTPWKCNGPHLSDLTPYALSGRAAEDASCAKQDEQDRLDGEALRRLREALPRDSELEKVQGMRVEASHAPYVGVARVYAKSGDYVESDTEWYVGVTIAEAADKCRAALS